MMDHENIEKSFDDIMIKCGKIIFNQISDTVKIKLEPNENLNEPNFHIKDESIGEDCIQNEQELKIECLNDIKTEVDVTPIPTDITSAPNEILLSELNINYPCTKCNYTSNLLADLAEHVKLHVNKRPVPKRWIQCPECDYKAGYKSIIERHMDKHATEKTFSCKECEYTTVRSTNLKIHMEGTHRQDRPYKCGECDYSAKQKNSLKQHIINIHTNEKRYKCDQCDYCASQSSKLKEHMNRHKGDHPFKCPECHYSFTYKSVLRKHLLTHSKEKPFKCSECEYSGISITMLKLHISNMHCDEKPHLCSECGYAAKQKHSLQLHIFNRHAKEKPHKCTMCTFATARYPTLTQHIKRRHCQAILYKCLHCEYTTDFKPNLRRHVDTRVCLKNQDTTSEGQDNIKIKREDDFNNKMVIDIDDVSTKHDEEVSSVKKEYVIISDNRPQTDATINENLINSRSYQINRIGKNNLAATSKNDDLLNSIETTSIKQEYDNSNSSENIVFIVKENCVQNTRQSFCE